MGAFALARPWGWPGGPRGDIPDVGTRADGKGGYVEPDGAQHLELLDPLANCRRRRNERLRRAVRHQLDRAESGFVLVHPATALAASLTSALEGLRERVAALSAVPSSSIDRLVLTQLHAGCSDLVWLTREVTRAQDAAESAHAVAEAAQARLFRPRAPGEAAQQRLAHERREFASLSGRLAELDRCYGDLLTDPPRVPGRALSRLTGAYDRVAEDARSLVAA